MLMAAAVASATASCGDAVLTGSSPVFLVIDSLQGARGGPTVTMGSSVTSDVLTNITTPAPCTTTTPCPTIFSDPGQVTLRLSLKNIGSAASPATPTSNNEVTITQIHVAYQRADGRHIEGVDVPYAFDTAATATVPATGSVTFGFILVRNDAKAESPLVELRNNGVVISTIANVTFYGHDRVGNAVSVAGSIGIEFGRFSS
jgi:hypothetical protein